jgi:hypothetical protein
VVPFKTVYLPLSYIGNPGVNDESYRGVNWKRLGAPGRTSGCTSQPSSKERSLSPAFAVAAAHRGKRQRPSI